ncbi:MAG: site-2 protease family protein [Pseudomonadota bacterium]
MLEILSVLESLPTPQLISVAIIPVLFAITVHEVAHGWIAKYLGDPTAHRLGRLSFNPLRHIDPVGTVLIPALFLLMGSRFLFGWAKPVPVTWENLRHPKRDMVLVAFAGPAANLMMAVIWGIVTKITMSSVGELGFITKPLFYMGLVGILANVLLFVFNLLPIPPLDGGRVAVGLLPGRLSWQLSRVEPFGFFILLALMISNIIWFVIYPVANVLIMIVRLVVGL